MKILVFTEGTVIMHKSALGLSRKRIVKQVIENRDPSLRDWASYVPVGKAVSKLNSWKNQQAQILYLTSRIKDSEIAIIGNVLRKHDFPDGTLLHRTGNNQYKDVAEKAMPDLIIEDDCESIGGLSEMTYTSLRTEVKEKIKHIVVKEFEGIDNLPDEITDLTKERG